MCSQPLINRAWNYLFLSRKQTEQCVLSVLLPTLPVVFVDLFIRHLVKQVRQQLVTLGRLQVKYTAGPTPPGNRVHVDRLPLVDVILHVLR